MSSTSSFENDVWMGGGEPSAQRPQGWDRGVGGCRLPDSEKLIASTRTAMQSSLVVSPTICPHVRGASGEGAA